MAPVAEEPWPWSKVDADFATVDAGAKPCVLVGVQALSPMHLGHMQMMMRARDRLERDGYSVVGEWIAVADASQGENDDLTLGFRRRMAHLVADASGTCALATPAKMPPGGSLLEAATAVVGELQETASLRLQEALEAAAVAGGSPKRTGRAGERIHTFLVTCADISSKHRLHTIATIGNVKNQGVVIVPAMGEDKIEKPQQLTFVADPPDPELEEITDFASKCLRAAVQCGDAPFVVKMLSREAARFLLEPTAGERRQFATDYRILAGTTEDKAFPTERFAENVAEALEQSNHMAVLVVGGPLCPLHNGHLELLEAAKERLTRAGYQVVAIWLAPHRVAGSASAALSQEFVLRMVEAASAGDPLVAVARLEHFDVSANMVSDGMPRHVTDRLMRTLKSRFRYSLERRVMRVFYVAGSTAAKKQGLNRGIRPQAEQGVVIVPRDQETCVLEKASDLVFAADPVTDGVGQLSSRMLLEFVRSKDARSLMQVMPSGAARFLLSPTPMEYHQYRADFENLGVSISGLLDMPMGLAGQKLKGALQAWLGPGGRLQSQELLQLLALVDPAWKAQPDLLQGMGGVLPDGSIDCDSFVDSVFRTAGR